MFHVKCSYVIVVVIWDLGVVNTQFQEILFVYPIISIFELCMGCVIIRYVMFSRNSPVVAIVLSITSCVNCNSKLWSWLCLSKNC